MEVWRLIIQISFIVVPFKPTGDQPQAITKLIEGIKSGLDHHTLLGVTGSGNTFTMADVVEEIIYINVAQEC